MFTVLRSMPDMLIRAALQDKIDLFLVDGGQR